MIKRFLPIVFLLGVLAFASSARAVPVCFNAYEWEPVTGTTNFCSLQIDYGAGSSQAQWEQQCTAATLGYVMGIVPQGTSNVFRSRFTYTTPDASGSDACKALVSVLSLKGSCSTGSSNPGVACDSGSTTCTGGGTCSGAPPKDISSVDFSAPENTLTHVADAIYTTPWTATQTIERYNINTTTTVNCAGNECNFQGARVYVQLYSSGSTSTRCDYVQFCLDFP